jgi:hypothetical protein
MTDVKRPLFSIPVASTAFSSDAHVVFDGGNLAVRFAYREVTGEANGEILFRKTRAFRHRAEIYCTVWHIGGAYDTVVELDDSQWKDELREAAPAHQMDQWTMKHFMIYLDSFGCLEVIAESAHLR